MIGRALNKLTRRGVIEAGDFPLTRFIFRVIEHDESLDVPWEAFFGGQRAV